MLKAVTDADVLRQVVDVVSTLVDEAKFKVDKDGISLRAVDPAHVAMVELSLSKNAFDEYSGTETELGIDMERLEDILRLAHSGEKLAIEHTDGKNHLVVTIGRLTRRMALVDTAGMSDPRVPNIELPSSIVLKAEQLSFGLKASDKISDHIALVAEEGYFEMSSEGDSDSVEYRLPKDDLVAIDSKQKVRSLFPLDYFQNMARAISPSSQVTINLGNNYPVRMEFDIAEGKGHVKYLLAPRVES